MERNSTIDIMKGLAIILMLFIHAPFVGLGVRRFKKGKKII